MKRSVRLRWLAAGALTLSLAVCTAPGYGQTGDLRVGSQAGGTAGRATRVQGRVIRLMGSNQFVVRTADGREMILVANPQTQYQMNGRAGRFTDLREGAEVTALYDTFDQRHIANSVMFGGIPDAGAAPGGALGSPAGGTVGRPGNATTITPRPVTPGGNIQRTGGSASGTTPGSDTSGTPSAGPVVNDATGGAAVAPGDAGSPTGGGTGGTGAVGGTGGTGGVAAGAGGVMLRGRVTKVTPTYIVLTTPDGQEMTLHIDSNRELMVRFDMREGKRVLSGITTIPSEGGPAVGTEPVGGGTQSNPATTNQRSGNASTGFNPAAGPSLPERKGGPVTLPERPTQNPDVQDRPQDLRDRRPAPDDRQPGAGTRQPAPDDRRPATSDRQPNAGAQRPSTNERLPNANDRQPGAGNRQPTPDDRQPAPEPER